MDNSTIITTRQLITGYAKKKLSGYLNLELQQGALTCLLGPNGTGKTTLLRTLSGMLPPVKGSAWLHEQNIHTMNASSLSRKLSVVLTDHIDTGHMDGFSLVAMGRYPYTNLMGRLSSQDQKMIQWAIEITEISHLVSRPMHQLSDGERQKVMIARALAQDTPVIILDEPTVHLDLPNRINIMTLLRKLVRETGKTALMATHDLDLATQVADQLWLLNEGGLTAGVPEDLVLDGSLEQLFKKDGTYFDLFSGSFRIVPKTIRQVQLQGEGVAFTWTKRALERSGFKMSDVPQSPKIHVEEKSGKICWHITNHTLNGVCFSIHDVLKIL